MEKLINYLKKNIKLAYKSVTFHAKQYLCFYVAVFVIQVLFGMIVMSNANNNYNERKTVEDKYDYHVLLSNLNTDQYSFLTDNKNYVFTNDKVFTIVREETVTINYRTYRNVYIFLENENNDNVKELYSKFDENVLTELRRYRNGWYSSTRSPLYTVESRVKNNNIDCFYSLILLSVVSVIILVLLYNIRINHFKFIYGIYMSFGADFKRIFVTSFWEIAVISFLTLIPSGIVATTVNALTYITAGYNYHFTPYFTLLSGFYTFPLIIIALYLPMKVTAIKPPLKLLLAEDNSNLVKSPRISSQLFGTKFPSAYEKLGMSRFRKYNAQLLLSAVLFSVMFICVSFYSYIYNFNIRTSNEEYVIHFIPHDVIEEVIYETQVTAEYYTDFFEYEAGKTDALDKYKDPNKYRIWSTNGPVSIEVFENYDPRTSSIPGFIIYRIDREEVSVTKYSQTYSESMQEELLTIPEISGIYKQCSTNAFDVSSLLLIPSNKTVFTSNLMLDPKNTDMSVSNQAMYLSADSEVVKYIEENYQYTGNPSKILTDKKQVIISDSYNNSKKLKLKEGDVIKIAKLESLDQKPTEDLYGDYYLEFLLSYGTFSYEEYTVCAVVSNIPTDERIPVFFSHEDYEIITGEKPVYSSVSIFIDAVYTDEEINDLTKTLKAWATKYTDTSIEWKNSALAASTELSKRKSPLIITAAIILLAIAPLFWFFSQIMFYKKRDKEFELLRNMGAIENEIKKIFIFDGIIYAIIGVVMTALFGCLGMYISYRISLSTVTTSMRFRYVFQMPWLIFIIGLIMTALFAFMASYIPYYINKKQNDKRETVQFEE